MSWGMLSMLFRLGLRIRAWGKAATNVVLNIRLFVSYRRRINIYGLKPLGKIVVLGTMKKIVNELKSTELNCFSITYFFNETGGYA